jgi:hypothetical protein
MPEMPTFPVTQVQADRIREALGSVDNVRRIYRQAVIDAVIEAERAADEQVFKSTRTNKEEQVRSLLGDPAEPV